MIASLIQSKNTRSDNKMTIQGEKGTIYISPAPSKITKVELDISGNKEILSETPDLNSTTATLERIVGMIESKDEKVYAQNIEHIKTVMEILVQARKCAGIVFKTDK
jgi:hypothetical protein